MINASAACLILSAGSFLIKGTLASTVVHYQFRESSTMHNPPGKLTNT